MSEPRIRNLTTAAGVVATTATEITAGAGDHARRLNLKFCNVGSQTETLILTISRNSATARRIKRVVLEPNEEFKLGGMPLNQSDSLLAVTTTADSVEYTIAIASPDADYTEATYDDAGREKHAPYILEQLDAINSPVP